MSFVTDLFKTGGAGSSLINSGGEIGTGLVKNEGDKIRGEYQVKLAELHNDATLSAAQFQVSLDKLNQDRNSALASYNDQKRGDTLKLVALIGGLFIIASVSILLIVKRNKK